MGCDSQFDGLYDERDRRLDIIEARGFRAVRRSLTGPFEHTGCGAIVGNMDIHDTVCPHGKKTVAEYKPRHRAEHR